MAKVPFVLYDTDGNPTPSISLSGTGVVRVSVDGGQTWANRAGAAPVSAEDGVYYYVLDSSEVLADGFTLVKVNLSGYRLVVERANFDSGAAAAAAVMSFTLRTGRTPLGLFRRLDSLFFGKVTGLLSSLVQAYQPGGTVVEFSANQDTDTGTRAEVDVTVSETP